MPSILTSRRGVAITEFAILSPVLILLIAGCLEVGRLAMIQSSLEAAMGKAARSALVDLNSPEDERLARLEASILNTLAPYSPQRDDIEIRTTVYRDFGSSYPEAFDDQNNNGRYDGPNPPIAGEPFEDRNRNGVRDLAAPVAGVLGQEGQVVTYHVSFRVTPLFSFLPFAYEEGERKVLYSTVVSRNEPVK